MTALPGRHDTTFSRFRLVIEAIEGPADLPDMFVGDTYGNLPQQP